MSAFHDVDFPLALARGAKLSVITGGEVVQLASGREVRNARWARARRRWNIAGAISSEARLKELIAFFEARRGNAHAFRFRDALNCSSGVGEPGPSDQIIGLGDGANVTFQLVKDGTAITKPVPGSVRVSVDGAETPAFTVDHLTGVLTMGDAPALNAEIRAGFLFDTPARFEAATLEITLDACLAGRAPSISLIEVRE